MQWFYDTDTAYAGCPAILTNAEDRFLRIASAEALDAWLNSQSEKHFWNQVLGIVPMPLHDNNPLTYHSLIEWAKSVQDFQPYKPKVQFAIVHPKDVAPLNALMDSLGMESGRFSSTTPNLANEPKSLWDWPAFEEAFAKFHMIENPGVSDGRFAAIFRAACARVAKWPK